MDFTNNKPVGRSVEDVAPEAFDYREQAKDLDQPLPPEDIHPLDKAPVRKRFAKVVSWFMQERLRQVDFRIESMIDHEFYDGPGQWTEEERRVLAERSQVPITFNQVKPTVDWVIGTEKKIRVDYRVLPREENDAKAAESKTKLFKYVSDANNAGFKRSKSFADAVLAGVGWIDHTINTDPDDEPLVVTYEDWRYIWWDTLATEEDLSDARYVFRGKWVDLDVACAMFPERADVLQASVLSADQGSGYDLFAEMYDPAIDIRQAGGIPAGGGTGNSLQYTGFFGYIGGQGSVSPRDRVFLVECQYRVPVTKKILRGKMLGSLNGITFMEDVAAHQNVVAMGIAQPVESTTMEVRQMIFTGDYVLQDGESPYRHKRFSLVPIWGFKRKKDGTPYGIVRNLRDPQKDLNKRRSKALYLLSANRVVADDDAIDGTDQSWGDIVQEANRPDGLIKQNPKSQRGIKIENEAKMAEEHVQLMSQDERYIQSASGVTDELMGRDTNAVSGKAVRARQEQGSVITTAFFDNQRLAFKLSGEIILSLIEQLYTEEKKVRITGGENGQNAEFLAINSVDPDTGEMSGDITSSQADFVISEQDYSGTIRQAMFESLTDMIKTMQPEASMQILDLVFELSDLPGKEKFVERLRKITGQRGTETVPTDEEKAQDAAKQQQAQIAMQAEQDVMMAQLAQEKAKVAKLEKEAELIAAKVQTEGVNRQVKAFGVEYDQEKLRIEKATALNAIEQNEHARSLAERQQMVTNDQPAEQDIRMKEHDIMNNDARADQELRHNEEYHKHELTMAERQQAQAEEEAAHARKLKDEEHKAKLVSVKHQDRAMIQHAKTAGTSRERGLKSNNEK